MPASEFVVIPCSDSVVELEQFLLCCKLYQNVQYLYAYSISNS